MSHAVWGLGFRNIHHHGGPKPLKAHLHHPDDGRPASEGLLGRARSDCCDSDLNFRVGLRFSRFRSDTVYGLKGLQCLCGLRELQWFTGFRPLGSGFRA